MSEEGGGEEYMGGGPPATARPVARHTYSHRPLRWLLLPLLAVAAGLAAYLARGRAAASDSLAILPFAVGAGDPGAEALGDGIRETLTGAFSRLPRVRIIAVDTMDRIRPGAADPWQVGRELGVRAVVTGRVAQRGDTVAIDVELVSVADGARLWGDSFIRPLSDILTVQDDLAVGILQQLRASLSPAERGLLRTRHTGDVAAYVLYAKGRHHWSTRTPRGTQDAITCFTQAVAADPGYALAWASLANCYTMLGAEDGAVPQREAPPKARAAASRAVALDPSLAEAHAALGRVLWRLDRDGNAAERELRRAIELAPGYANAHWWLAELLAESGRSRDAGLERRRALDLDPLSPEANASLAR